MEARQVLAYGTALWSYGPLLNAGSPAGGQQ